MTKERVLITFKDLQKGDRFWDEGGRFKIVEPPKILKGRVFLVTENNSRTTVRFEIPAHFRLPKTRDESYVHGKPVVLDY